jgi:hypothetical protein
VQLNPWRPQKTFIIAVALTAQIVGYFFREERIFLAFINFTIIYSMTDAIKSKLYIVSNNSVETTSGVLDDDCTYSFTILDCISPTTTDLSQAERSRLYALYESYRELSSDLPCEIFVVGGGSLFVEKYPMMFDFVRLVKKAGGTVSFHRGVVSTSPTPNVQRTLRSYKTARQT